MALYIFILVGFLFAKAEDEVLQSLQFLQTHVGLNTTSQRSHNETALAARGICVTDDKLTVKDLTCHLFSRIYHLPHKLATIKRHQHDPLKMPQTITNQR
ncbi:unnamed protein product [Durusdinium trenchii]|uniref:Secreted protein n=1 Tax=Durusdinium trenchii TaxID=1381693 RepID=A0ABP0J907_9DINO